MIMRQLKRPVGWNVLLASLGVLMAVMLAGNSMVTAEYGDVVMNRRSEAGGVAGVVFPHWFHRIRFRCKVCHGDLGFAMKAGGNDITMLNIIDGEYCGACHNGEMAWASERCDLCHSAKAGLSTQVDKGGTVKAGTAPQTGTGSSKR